MTKVRVVRRHPTEEERKQFGREKRRAREYVNNKQQAAQLIKEAIEKANRNKGALTKLLGKLTALFRLAGAWVKGEYTDVSLKTILWVIAAIIYFVNPFDVITDFIPGVGYVDDAAIIFFVINSIRHDLDKFLKWERSRK
ncbi:MAG: YkvA family protein [Planctomycetota bacterium]